MKIELLAAGQKPPHWIQAGVDEYSKRLPGSCEFRVREVPIARRTRNTSPEKAMMEEEARFAKQINRDAHVVALDRSGRDWSTEDLAARLALWMQEAPLVQMLVGGPDGLSKNSLAAAKERWSLSAPASLSRIVKWAGRCRRATCAP